jgi:F-type H+-transporting ATPase subunit b
VLGKLWLLLAALALIPGEALASGGLRHAEEWVLRRDGAWIFNFLILFSGLYWIFLRYIIPALKQRTVDIQNTLTEAERIKDSSAHSLREIEEKSEKFETYSMDLKNDAVAEGDKIREKIIADGKEQSKRILKKAQTEIAAEIMSSKRRLRVDTVEFAMDLARKSLAKGVGKKDHEEIVKVYLDSVKEG